MNFIMVRLSFGGERMIIPVNDISHVKEVGDGGSKVVFREGGHILVAERIEEIHERLCLQR